MYHLRLKLINFVTVFLLFGEWMLFILTIRIHLHKHVIRKRLAYEMWFLERLPFNSSCFFFLFSLAARRSKHIHFTTASIPRIWSHARKDTYATHLLCWGLGRHIHKTKKKQYNENTVLMDNVEQSLGLCGNLTDVELWMENMLTNPCII